MAAAVAWVGKGAADADGTTDGAGAAVAAAETRMGVGAAVARVGVDNAVERAGAGANDVRARALTMRMGTGAGCRLVGYTAAGLPSPAPPAPTPVRAIPPHIPPPFQDLPPLVSRAYWRIRRRGNDVESFWTSKSCRGERRRSSKVAQSGKLSDFVFLVDCHVVLGVVHRSCVPAAPSSSSERVPADIAILNFSLDDADHLLTTSLLTLSISAPTPSHRRSRNTAAIARIFRWDA
ncbi:hypothetical protein PLICRDRAFT_170669 [Plicaturopsis crispa FD-325 SS-3]|nr:hypothetical protein PLICRDRAFT_170669 [Plicaturopsis crispa FD-325 SS-3]